MESVATAPLERGEAGALYPRGRLTAAIETDGEWFRQLGTRENR
jgi:hypothetical protein